MINSILQRISQTPYLVVFYLVLCSCVQKMGTQGHLRPQGEDPALAPLSGIAPAWTVPQSESRTRITQGISKPVTKQILEKGQEQYAISCVPCHGPSGYGNGIIVQRGFLAPPSYHTDRLRRLPDSHFYDVITHGFGAMYSYADRVSESNRWAIIAYIRALQLSQNARWEDLSTQDQVQLQKETSR